MLDFIFGWRKASKCIKLIKRTQCRLKLLKSKRFAVVRLLKEDIAQLLKNEHEEIAMKKLGQLYVDENVLSIYEMLTTFLEFILLNLSYIRRHKDIPNDINEAISTLIFASARIGDLPELRLIRKLFTERYGKRFITAATELYPGNLVNSQVKEKFTSQSVPEDVKNRMVDEIVRHYFFRPGQFAIEYKPVTLEKLEKVNESSEVQRYDTDRKEKGKISNSYIGLQSLPSIPNTPRISRATEFTQLSPRSKQNIGRQTSDSPILHLDNIEEFRSGNYQRVNFEDQDQRFFMFRTDTHTPNHQNDYPEAIQVPGQKQARKRMRRKKSVSKEKPSSNNAQQEIYYSSSPGNRRKYQKKNYILEKERNYFDGKSNKNIEAFDCCCKHLCSLDQPCYLYANSNQGSDIILLSKRCCDVWPYVRDMKMPLHHESETSKEIRRSSYLPVEKGFHELSVIRNTTSPKHVHPKLPDYDEIAAIFGELKKAHLQIKGTP